MIVLLNACLVFLVANNSVAQEPLKYQQFTTDQGLSENVVHCLLQDRIGFIWVGTHEGLNRYDGYGFRKYTFDPADKSSLPNSAVTSLYLDRNDDLVVITSSGLSRMDPVSGKFMNLHSSMDRIFSKAFSTLGITDRHLQINFQIDPHWYPSGNRGKPGYLPITPMQARAFDSTARLAIFFDSKANLWVLGPNRLTIIDSNGVQKAVLEHLNLQQERLITRLYNDMNGNLWVRAPGKLICISKKDFNVHTIVYQSQLPDFPFENVQTLLYDRSGVLWMGSFYGLKKINLNPGYFRHYSSEAEGLASNFVLGLNVYKNKLFIQHYFLDSFYSSIDLSTRVTTKMRIDRVPADPFFREVVVKEPNRAGELSWKTQLSVMNSLEIDRRMIRYLYTDRDGRIWSFYFQDKIFNLLDSTCVYFKGSAEQLYDDGRFLWIATTSSGLVRYDKSDQSVKQYRANTSQPGSIPSDNLLCLEQAANGRLWIGTRASGVISFDKTSERFISYTKNEGLCNNTIYNIVFDNAGNLWMGTAAGLSCMDTRAKKFRNFYRADGLQNSEFNRWSAVKDQDGNLYFGGMNGIDYFSPSEVLKGTYLPPDVQITAFKTGNELQPLQQDQALHYKQNYISFEFSGMDFRNPSATQYMYRLEGTGGEWIRAEGNHTAAFAALPPGKYTFVIKAAAQNGIWSEAKNFSFRIRAPWWQQSWFYALCILTFLGILYTFYRIRINQLKKVIAMRARISRDLHDDVGASLSSIHIYSSVAQKSLQHDHSKAQAALEKINESSRKVLEDMSDIVWALNPREHDGKSFSGRIKNFGSDLLSQQQIECNYRIDPQAEKKMVNPDARKNILMIVKEALHNIAKYSGATHAEVRITLEGTYLVVYISDNGKGIAVQEHRKGNGLLNMKQRTEDMGGHFKIDSGAGKGTSITCTIPITNFSDTVIGKV